VWQFDPICKDCQQILRNEKKNEDRPLSIIRGRAATRASAAGISCETFWIKMKYYTLVPVLRALMSPEGLCQNCGEKFLNERDIQIEHREPPRGVQDWARLHARNIGFYCGSCNRAKSSKSYADWLERAEETRQANDRESTEEARLAAEEVRAEQARLIEVQNYRASRQGNLFE
jgi:5-methylcytosine-specific restriction endonuclease McrA